MLERMGKWGRKMTRGSRGQEEMESGREIWKEDVADYFPRWLQEYHPSHMLLLSSCKNLSEYVTQKGCYAIKGDSFHLWPFGDALGTQSPWGSRKNHMEEATAPTEVPTWSSINCQTWKWRGLWMTPWPWVTTAFEPSSWGPRHCRVDPSHPSCALSEFLTHRAVFSHCLGTVCYALKRTGTGKVEWGTLEQSLVVCLNAMVILAAVIYKPQISVT